MLKFRSIILVVSVLQKFDYNTTIYSKVPCSMARDEIILKTLAHILILVLHLYLRGSTEEPTRACLKKFFCPQGRDIMLSLWSLQSPNIVYFSTIFHAYKLSIDCPQRRDIMLSLGSLQSAYIVYFSTILHA